MKKNLSVEIFGFLLISSISIMGCYGKGDKHVVYSGPGAQRTEYCEAETNCSNGLYLHCEAHGDQCQYDVLPGSYVHCEGYDAHGNQVDIWKNCW